MGFFKLTIRDVPIDNHIVLVRADYNVPLDKDGKISDDLRIKANLPTLKYLHDHGCKIVVISHLGRPEGRDPKYSLEQVAVRLSKLMDHHVEFVDDCIGDRVTQTIKKSGAHSITLLENLRYYKEEEADDEAFAKNIAKSTGARYFVQDGFGVVHRAHASTHAITLCIPSVAGLLLEREYETITGAMQHPQRPLVAIMGGAKISDKIAVIERFVHVADNIIIGGAMANTFLAYKGVEMGASMLESDQTDTLDRIYHAAHEKVGDEVDTFIILPQDVAVAKEIAPKATRRSVGLETIESDDIALDIGDRTIEHIVATVAKAKTVIWNGTLGYAELPEFAHGSARLALALATQPQTASIIGGGDTADFVLKWDNNGGKSFTHVSTGGGASLELMAGDTLPGIESLLDARK
ncbi:MAG: phosphoglycerate kinase [Candidatus Microsaccharimonas sossegonensis]|uniref:Phosphoglycerate kinase n=1 Tax=Candidatus Microsaccharimonas sossegonensis TaxID=2506948 RepID=A0A4Q0AGS4_9BACT|nr:MAG: phosphoglycerate kinase [Candidatus Microsaccharimonas sossegonensis]